MWTEHYSHVPGDQGGLLITSGTIGSLAEILMFASGASRDVCHNVRVASKIVEDVRKLSRPGAASMDHFGVDH